MSGIRTAAGRGTRLVANLLLVTVLLGSVAFVVTSLVGYERYVITGGSMSGTFEVGSVVVEKPVPVEDLRVGDVITYLPPAQSQVTNLVTHRLVKIRVDERTGRTYYVTKGDANQAEDPWTFQINGAEQPRVVFSVPVVGHVFLLLADRQARLLLIGLPALVIASMALVELGIALRGRRSREPVAPLASVPTRESVEV